MDYEDIIANFIDEAFCDCEEEFERDASSEDLVYAFNRSLDDNLTTFEQDCNNEDVDIEHVERLAERCRKTFKNLIEDAIGIAHQKALEAFEEELEAIADEMLADVQDHAQAVNF